MPSNRPPETRMQRSRANFRRRFDDLERQRNALIARATALGAAANRHAGYRRALTLLNATFRKSSLAQRAAVLQAAAWLIDLLERLTPAV